MCDFHTIFLISASGILPSLSPLSLSQFPENSIYRTPACSATEQAGSFFVCFAGNNRALAAKNPIPTIGCLKVSRTFFVLSVLSVLSVSFFQTDNTDITDMVNFYCISQVWHFLGAPQILICGGSGGNGRTCHLAWRIALNWQFERKEQWGASLRP